MSGQIAVELTVNGIRTTARVKPDTTLLQYLRSELGLTGTKNGCSKGHCGTCTLVLNDEAIRSCTVRMDSHQLQGARVETIEGLAPEGKLHALQASFVEEGAVQCGFCTPGMIMSAKALLAKNPDPGDGEIRRWLSRHRNICRCTGYAPIVRAIQKACQRIAAGQSVVEIAALLSGEKADTPRLRKDAIDQVRGLTSYSDDLKGEGMLYGKILWSAHAHADICGIDCEQARAMKGVAAVLTAEDIPGENIAGILQLDQPAIARDRVRFIGDPVAAVFAETPEAAEAAVGKIGVEYRVLEAVFSPEQAARKAAPKIHKKGNLLHEARIARGDVRKAFQRCSVIVDHAFSTPAIEHAFLEPEAGIGIPNPDGGVTLKMGTQCAFDDRSQLARILALPEDKIRVIQQPMGGAFGAKEDILIYQFLALGALKCKRPVKITLSREESLRTHPKRHPAVMHYRVGADAEGKLVAVEAEITLDGGAYASLSVDVLENCLVFGCGPYHVPEVEMVGRVWYTNRVPSGAMRGFGVMQVAFAFESCLDEIARRLEIDPFEIRERNALTSGLPTIADHVLEDGVPGIKETIRAAREAFRSLKMPKAGAGKRIGVGVAAAVKNIGFGHGAEESAAAVVELDARGRLAILASQHEYGQGSRAGLVRLAAESLDIAAGQVEISWTDTARTPPTGPTTASRQTFMTGNALVEACRQLKADLAAGLEVKLQRSVQSHNLHIDGANLVDRGSGTELPLSDLIDGPEGKIRKEYRYHASSTAPLLEGESSHWGGNDFISRRTHWCYTYGTHVAVVEVDESSGEVQVLTIIAAHDVGRIVNSGAVRGQVEGGVMMGVGYALSEQFQVERGINLTDDLLKCGLPTADRTPEILPVFVEVPHPEGPLGLKGLAEGPSLPTAPAICNAIYDAVGVRIYDLPALPEKLKAAL
ncbi:MAG: molybdopterin-dependent oxidoreductase [Spirochaetaceae bacterium]|nr:MAG: molybdopterin-dependent oxidoreductase [Spirochaetaceae bacterium]